MLVAVRFDNLEKDLVRIVTDGADRAAAAIAAAPAVAAPDMVVAAAVAPVVAAAAAVVVVAAASSCEVTSETLPLIFPHFLQSTNKEKKDVLRMVLVERRDADHHIVNVKMTI